MTPAARTFKGSFLFRPRGQIPRARRGQTHAPFPTVNYEDSQTGTVAVEVTQADYQQVNSNRGKTTFSATLEDDGSYSYLQFTTVDRADEINKGQKLSVHAINYTQGMTSGHYFTDDYSGTITVADVQGKRITLSFANFKFNRELDRGEKQAITINGNISFEEQ